MTANQYTMTSARVLPVLHITKTGAELDHSAFNSVLDKVGIRPVVIISIGGETRTGKSYLLNFFLRYFEAQQQQQSRNSPETTYDWTNFPISSSFVWRGGKERETTGMNLWSEPYFVSTDKGEVAVLLMDTQGLFDDQTTARQNAIIFSLTALCSSVVIYNVMRQVNEDLLQQIQYFSGYANMVADESRSSPAHFTISNESATSVTSRTKAFLSSKAPFQNLLLVVRDFEIPGYVHGLHERMKEPEGSRKNFMRDTFHLQPPPVNCPEENTIVRQEILQKFDDVSVYLLPDPGKKFIRENSTPDEDFQDQLKYFVEYVVSSKYLERCIKRVDGRPCTGVEFKSFVNIWARLIERSKETFPEVSTMAENTAFVQYTIAKDMAVTLFTKKMDELITNLENGFGPSKNNLYLTVEHIKQDSFRLFERLKKFKNSKFDIDFGNQLNNEMSIFIQTSPRLYDFERLLKERRASTGTNPISKEHSFGTRLCGYLFCPILFLIVLLKFVWKGCRWMWNGIKEFTLQCWNLF